MSSAASCKEVSFLDALKMRYGAEDDINQYDSSAFLVGDSKRRRNKTWEMVGMESTRQKQSRYDRLVHVVLRNLGITVAVKASEKAKEEEEGGSNSAAAGAASATTITTASRDELAQANMRCLQELDLSENVGLSFEEISKLLAYFSALEILQVSDSPQLLLQATGVTAMSSTHITKLVFNNIGFRSLFQLRQLVDLPNLLELHLDSNGLESFELFANSEEEQASRARMSAKKKGNDDDAAEKDKQWLSMSNVTTLSLAHNRISTWGRGSGLARTIATAFPKLSRLFLTDNVLPNLILPSRLVTPLPSPPSSQQTEGSPVGEDAATPLPPVSHVAELITKEEVEADAKLLEELAFLHPLKLLCLNDNAAITDPRTIDAVRILCPELEAFRITYGALLPRWNETLSRMFVVASLPTITLLNRGQVRPKERLDSEVFYVQRGLAKREKEKTASAATGADGNSVASDEPEYPLLDTLQDKYKDLVLSIYREGTTASSGSGAESGAHVMLDVTLHCENHYKPSSASGAGGGSEGTSIPTVRKQLPSNLTVGKLKTLIKMTFQIDPTNQDLSYQTGDAEVLQRPIALDNEMESLGYYGVCDGAIIHVRDTSVR